MYLLFLTSSDEAARCSASLLHKRQQVSAHANLSGSARCGCAVQWRISRHHQPRQRQPLSAASSAAGPGPEETLAAGHAPWRGEGCEARVCQPCPVLWQGHMRPAAQLPVKQFITSARPVPLAKISLHVGAPKGLSDQLQETPGLQILHLEHRALP